MKPTMTSLERVLAALRFEEPDRVPLFLNLTMHGAREVQTPLPEFLQDPESYAEGQLRLQKKYGHDCLVATAYGAADVQAWGAEVIFRDDGPPNAGAPLITDVEDIRTLETPDVRDNPAVQATLRVIEILAERSHDIPIVGGAIAPFSLPILQLGFEPYLKLLHERPDLFERLMAVNEEFYVQVVNAQLAAGATAIGYADPMSSSTIVSPKTFREIGSKIAARTIARVKGGVAISFASGRCRQIIADIAETGALGVQVGPEEDLAELKRVAGGKVTVVGNLNGVAMRHWSPQEAEAEVKRAIAAAAPGAGFVLSDGHGEIPFQVPDEVLHAIAEATREWGTYPLDWVD